MLKDFLFSHFQDFLIPCASNTPVPNNFQDNTTRYCHHGQFPSSHNCYSFIIFFDWCFTPHLRIFQYILAEHSRTDVWFVVLYYLFKAIGYTLVPATLKFLNHNCFCNKGKYNTSVHVNYAQWTFHYKLATNWTLYFLSAFYGYLY